MKKELLMVIVSFFLMSLTAITGVYAIGENKIITISEKKVDISGDGIDEVIVLKGVPYQEDDSFLKKIFIEVAGSNGKLYTFPLESGSKASLLLVDLNDDGIKDIFSTVLTGGSSGVIINSLFSLKNFIHTVLPLPEPLEMEGKFLNGYKAEVKLVQTGKTYLFHLRDRMNYYKKLGFYFKGKLNEPAELTINPFNSLEPIPLKNGKIGLLGLQRVTGVANADTIATVESKWVYENGKWKLLGTEVMKQKAK